MADQVSIIKDKTDIVSLIGEHVTLKKAGRNYKGLCPFHGEKTPSFMVNPELQIYKCFGCGESGDVISFLQKYEGMEFYEALKYLADRAGIKLQPRSQNEYGEKEELTEINRLAASLYHYLLIKSSLGGQFLDYLTKERGLGIKTISTFSLGAAPDSSSVLFNHLTKKRKYEPEMLVKAGVVVKNERGYFDRFRGRAIFPIFNHRGVPIALAGRILPKLDRGFGKYINSPETPIYTKSDSLYGLNVTKDAIRKEGVAIVVEGELDLLSAWQAGVKNIVAIKGSALTQGQLSILGRFAKGITLALDSDFAGDSAALRGITLAQNAGFEVRVADMGKYKDPDEFARAEPEKFLKVLSKPEGVWDFVIDVVFSRHDSSTGPGKARISQELVPLMASIEDRIVQSHYSQIVASKLGVPFEAVGEQIASSRQRQSPRQDNESTDVVKEILNRRQLLEERILGLALQGEPRLIIENSVTELFESHFSKKTLAKLKQYLAENEEFLPGKFINSLPTELQSKNSELFMQYADNEASSNELEETTRELITLDLKEKITASSKNISRLERINDQEALAIEQRSFSELTKKLAELET